jgi:hypothetical protein
MLIILPLAVFLTAWLLLLADQETRQSAVASWRAAWLIAAILLGGFVALSSEALSLVGWLSRPALAAVWGAALAGLLLYGVWRARLLVGFRRLWQQIAAFPWRSWESLPVLVIGLYVTALFVVALLSPPNTNDSLAYHMSRVAHWAQNHDLAHYATPIERQIWMPPWAEMAALHLYLLAGSDRAVNLVQWLSMITSLVGVSLIAARLGAPRNGQLFVALFCVTLPMGVLQATSTQNDYVNAGWVVCLVYFAITAHHRRLTPGEWLCLSASFGLGLLTKGTFIAYALPFLIGLLIATLRRGGWRATVGAAALGLIVTLTLNAGAWGRNLQTYGFPLGPPDEIANHSNTIFDPGVWVSNALRNSTLHLGTPWSVINTPLRQGVEMVLQWIGQDANDPRTTLTTPYRVKRSFHEDYAGNPWHFLLIPLGLGWLILSRERGGRGPAVIYAIGVLAAFWVFSALYKWQPTGSRLQLPFFVAWAPAAGAILAQVKLQKVRPILATVLVLAGLWPLLSNPSRPLLPTSKGVSILTTPRDELLFINTPEVMSGYLSIIDATQATGCRAIGLALDSHDGEYIFWALLAPQGSGIHLEHIQVLSSLAGYLPTDFRPCAIIATLGGIDNTYGLPAASTHYGGYTLYAAPSPP